MGNKMVEWLSKLITSSSEITDDILLLDFKVVNAFLLGKQNDDNGFVLVDTGLENSVDFILKSIEKRFGENSKPNCIILTHGHFDHVGSIIKLNEKWNVPIYIHELELPYVMGEKNYPLADPTVDEGLVAKLSPTFPHTSIDIKTNLKTLPEDGSIPYLPEWKWIHTPGHSEGHICLFREKDRTLIVSDAFCTVKQESLTSVITQDKEISGPPKYLTTNWDEAEKSVRKLHDLKPNLILPSHGNPIHGDEAKKYLDQLINNFKEIAIPEEGKFLDE